MSWACSPTALSAGSWVRGAAKSAGLPVFTIRSTELSDLARAVRTLLGAEPSPGGTFEARGSGSRLAGSGSSSSGGGGGVIPGAAKGTGASLADEADALEEARLAVEQFVLPQEQPVELLPRAARLVGLQVQLVAERYRLPTEVVGSEGSLRLRVLPPGWGPPPAPATCKVEAAAVGGRPTEYW